MAERTAEQKAGQKPDRRAEAKAQQKQAAERKADQQAERKAEQAESAGEATHVPEPPPPLLPDGALLVLLVLNGLLLGGFGLMFTPLYTNGIPVPMGAVLSILLLPWLVRQAGEIDARPAVAGAPLTAWVMAVGVLGLLGPGGDALLLPSWQSLLLLAGGIGAGLWALRAAMEQEYQRRAGG
jgi:hypothetical protein